MSAAVTISFFKRVWHDIEQLPRLPRLPRLLLWLLWLCGSQFHRQQLIKDAFIFRFTWPVCEMTNSSKDYSIGSCDNFTQNDLC